jgi:hypothetical protein
MRTAEEVFGGMPAEPGPGKLNWREYEHACLLQLIAWQNEILEQAALVAAMTPQGWAPNIAKVIRTHKRDPPAFSYQK